MFLSKTCSYEQERKLESSALLVHGKVAGELVMLVDSTHQEQVMWNHFHIITSHLKCIQYSHYGLTRHCIPGDHRWIMVCLFGEPSGRHGCKLSNAHFKNNICYQILHHLNEGNKIWCNINCFHYWQILSFNGARLAARWAITITKQTVEWWINGVVGVQYLWSFI